MKHHISCDHERHLPHQRNFEKVNFEKGYLWNVGVYVNDPNIDPNDEDDLEFFQDMVFESPYGRIHIFYYEELFKNYLALNRDWTLRTFSNYVLFLDKFSHLFSDEAFAHVYKNQQTQVVADLLKVMDMEIKLKFIRMADKYPNVMRAVPKLKLYNLFS